MPLLGGEASVTRSSARASAFGARVDHALEAHARHGVGRAPTTDPCCTPDCRAPSPPAATIPLAIDPATLPDELVVTENRTAGGVIMGVAHRSLPIVGVQFHPRGDATEGGYRLLANWLAEVGMPDAVATGGGAASAREVPGR